MIRKTKLAKRKNYGNKRALSIIEYIVLHFTANDGDTDEANGSYFANNVPYASAHLFVDDDSCTQSVSDDYVAYSVGGKKYPGTSGGKCYGVATNSNTLNIEMCDTVRDGRVYPTEKTLQNAAELVREKMKKYNIPIERVIRHYDVTGKKCPAYFVEEKAWQEFKKRLDANYKPDGKPETQAKPLPPKNNKIAVDGIWGPTTTRATQQFLGTVVDGIISNQPTSNKKYLYAASASTWKFKVKDYGTGSSVIKALQKKIGVKADGWFGKNSVLHLQKFLGVKRDGSMGPATVRAWQEYINSRL